MSLISSLFVYKKSITCPTKKPAR